MKPQLDADYADERR